jgi:4-hydroxybenzoate polyprenyltransferase
VLDRFWLYCRLMRLDKPIGIYLLLWPTLWGLWLAVPHGQMPPWSVLWVFVLGVVLMRSAGCAINDYFDHDLDAHVERTQHRPLAAGLITRNEALRVFVGVALIAYGLTTRLNAQTVLLSIPAVLLAASYPLAKRWLSIPQAYLGVAFSWGIPMGFMAIQNRIDWPLCLLLMAANLCWVVAYDTFYAMVDKPDDLKIGIRSSAIFFGEYDRLATTCLQASTVALLAAAFTLSGRWTIFSGLGLLAAAGIAIYCQWLVHGRDRVRCFLAFQRSHWFGLVVWLGLVV